ncbi:DUF5682 family protein [Bacteroides sp. 519]|uniref:DUF5682 family protein n=1 Tax=Bacteroides sp. 519 TaxID=2302937 RepID=UPI0013CFE901|nr:DUF5682 family protein [Bacteroides sp. 519]NDV57119.1 hypothetical protein [Bacteroides sp. 519]
MNLPEIETLFQKSFSANEQVMYFPVRHHSPACALHLQRTIETWNPDLLLIEGPSDSPHLMPYIGNTESEPPFCIYYSYDDKDGKINEEKEKYRAYYPFLEYSPELVAIRKGYEKNIPVRFIDLPYAVQLINKEYEQPETQFYYNENKEYEVNSYTAMIAARSGCRSFSEFWESRYELGAEEKTTEAFVRNVFFLGYFMRMATPETELSHREDLKREMHMATEIRQSLGEYKRILVIAGAYHIKGLMEFVKSGEEVKLKPCNPDHVAAYLMPYTFKEADSKSGYAAGMPFPAFYQSVWQKLGKQKEPYDTTILDYIIKTARFARKTQAISIPDEINALNMARSLAMLRNKPAAGVYELLDGVKSSFVKGDISATSTFEIDFLLRLLSGMGAGKVAANEFIPPVVLEFRALCALHRLKLSNVERQEVTLDIIKNPAHYRKSRFLHQLTFLNTGFCSLQSGPDYVNRTDKNLVRETWICRFSTQVETRLIDLSVYGASLSQICASMIEKEFKDNMTAEELSKLLISVQVMGVEGFYNAYEETIQDVIRQEKNFITLCKFLANLRYLANMQQLMDGEVHPLIPELFRMAFQGATTLVFLMKQVTEAEEQEVCEQMRNLYGFTLDPATTLDLEYFTRAVKDVVDDSFSNSRFFGTCLAIRYKQGYIQQEMFCNQITAYLTSSINEPEQAASFICGLFLIARDILFTDRRILEALDKVIDAVDNEKFLGILPNLRYAFTSFLPLELNRLSREIADYHNVSDEELAGSVIVSQEQVKQGILLDSLVGEALKLWNI